MAQHNSAPICQISEWIQYTWPRRRATTTHLRGPLCYPHHPRGDGLGLQQDDEAVWRHRSSRGFIDGSPQTAYDGGTQIYHSGNTVYFPQFNLAPLLIFPPHLVEQCRRKYKYDAILLSQVGSEGHKFNETKIIG
jgi:hypothetical protein